MNDDLISRQALIDRLTVFNEWCKDGRLQGSKFAVDVIKDMPSAEKTGQTIVKLGKWKHNRCTECGISLEDLFSGEFYYDDEELKFCPNCGAKMRGEAE